MRFGLLGPLVVVDDDGATVSVAGSRLRVLLAALLLHANDPVPIATLADAVWDGTPPAGADRTLRGHVGRLRRALGPAAERVAACEPGYLVRVSAAQLDVLEFEELCRDAGAAHQAGSWTTAADAATGALRLWRGTPLLDIPSQILRDEFVPHLERLRLRAFEWRIDADLHLGRHLRVVSELRGLTTAHPLHERFHAQLMLALARAGRPAEALAAYRNARRTLRDELGIEPGPELQRLQQRVLAGDTELLGPAPSRRTATVPRQLPPAAWHFVGRADELKALAELLTYDPAAPGTLVISAIDGMAGVGKTTLAVHFAHQVADRFPDGQLYVNLRGFDPSGHPTPPVEAVRGFLDALGADPATLPHDPDGQASRYRSLVADKRMLIVLDNARDVDQVVPLLPGSATCAVLVTSRRHLAGLSLHGARLLDLDTLPEPDAHDLLARLLGPERLAAEPDAAAELLASCAGLPLAVGIVAARAQHHPSFPLAALVDELRDAADRLDGLDAGDPHANLRAVVSWSARTLTQDAARLFGLLGVTPGPQINRYAAASLAGLPVARARSVLRELEQAFLVQQHIQGRYRMHDLIRLYATETARHDLAGDDRTAALRRVIDCYIHSAHTADRVLYPQRQHIRFDPPGPDVHPQPLSDAPAAQAWFDAEHAVLLTAQHIAADHAWHEAVWRLAWTMNTFCVLRGHRNDRLALWQAALRAAEHLSDPQCRIVAHRFLGDTFVTLARPEEGIAQLHHALALSEADTFQVARIHRGLAFAWEQRGDYRQALAHAAEARDGHRTLDQPVWEADALNAMGWYAAQLGEYDTALPHCRAALALHRQHDHAAGEATTQDSLGYIAHHTGDHQQAISCYRQALTLRRTLGHTYQTADTLDQLGHPHAALAQFDEARTVWREALDLYRRQGRTQDADRVRQQLDTLGP